MFKILFKILEKSKFNTIIHHVNTIVITLNMIMHICSSTCRRVAIIVPHLFNCFTRHSKIFVCGICPVLRLHHFVDNCIGIKLGKMMVIPGGNRCITASVPHNSIYMRPFFESNILISNMRIFCCQITQRTAVIFCSKCCHI